MTGQDRSGNVFDFLRLFAAVSVVVHHGVNILGTSFLWHGPEDNWWFGDGVAMFFIMSGMFVYISAERTHSRTSGWRAYAENRFLRIAPALYAYTLAIVAVLLLIGAIDWQALLSADVAVWFALSFVGLPGYDPTAFADFGTGILNGALWTIPAEVSFYFVVPLMYMAARRFGFERMLLFCAPIAVVSPLVAHLAGGTLEKLLHLSFLEYFSCFLLGVFWSKYWTRFPSSWMLAAVALAAYIAAFLLDQRGIGSILDPLIIAVPLSYVTVWLGFNGPQALRRFTRRIGDISFGTYIWHWPLINVFLWFGWAESLGSLAVPAVVAVSLLFGSLSWWGIERRALSRKRVSARLDVAS